MGFVFTMRTEGSEESPAQGARSHASARGLHPAAAAESPGSVRDVHPAAPVEATGSEPYMARLSRIRTALLDAPYSLCSSKAELITEYFRGHCPLPGLTRVLAPIHFKGLSRALYDNLRHGTPQSKWQIQLSNGLQSLYRELEGWSATRPLIVDYAHALAYVLERQELIIYDDELIVGNLSSQRIGAPIHPDLGGILLLAELEDLDRREVNPIRISAGQRRRLEEEVFPFWFTRSILARAPLFATDPQLQNTLMAGRRFILTQFAGISHVTPDYQSIIEKGFSGMLAEIRDAKRELHERRSRNGAGSNGPNGAGFDGTRSNGAGYSSAGGEQEGFYEAAEITLRAGIAFAERWSDRCRLEAGRCKDPHRARELLELAEIFRRVPAGPAETFHEALQSLFTAHVIVHQESFQHGVSFGRIDQYLYPYYRRDLEAGKITPGRAIELLGCFLGKAAEQLPLFNTMATEYFSGLSSASGLTLGGTDSEGRDASNELSLLLLRAYDHMRLRQPNLHLRVHPDSSAELLDLAYETLKKGGGMPAFFNDEAIVPALEKLGASHEHACDYAVVGCVEWGIARRSFPAAGAAFLSLPAVLDDILHPPKGAGASYRSMEEIAVAFEKALQYMVQEAVDGNDSIEKAHAAFRPTPFLSTIVDGCITKGRDVTAGGALYNSSGMQGVGLADVADSLTAIEQLVFEEKRLSLSELMNAVDDDFRAGPGQEKLRVRLAVKVPKYGQQSGRAEYWAARIARMYCATVRPHGNPRGGPYAPGFWTMTTHVGFGARLGALPSGRHAGRPLCDGISPANGADRFGPTASLMSAVAASGDHVANGAALNEKLDPLYLQGEAGNRLMDGLTRGYFSAGGMQVQYNIIDPTVLIDAKAHPERHRDLVVRISGYSAYFNDLTEAMKDDIIARSLHGAPGGPACMDVRPADSLHATLDVSTQVDHNADDESGSAVSVSEQAYPSADDKSGRTVDVSGQVDHNADDESDGAVENSRR